MAEIHYLVFIVLGVIVGGISLSVPEMRIFFLFGLGFLIWGIIKFFMQRKSTSSFDEQGRSPHNVSKVHAGMQGASNRTGSHTSNSQAQNQNVQSHAVHGHSPLHHGNNPTHHSHEYKRCPNCGRVSHQTYRFCPYCGYGV